MPLPRHVPPRASLWIGILVTCCAARAAAEPPVPTFRARTIDDGVQIGYGVALGDVDGDGKVDILLADKREFAWYRNPDWKRFVLCESPTREDNVCIAARDLDRDGKVEIAVGAGWNPGDTVSSGSVHYLTPEADRTTRWGVVTLPHEPTVHRMSWALNQRGKYELLVAPLKARGNQQGKPVGARLLAYSRPGGKGQAAQVDLVDDSMNMTHNLDIVDWDGDLAEEVLLVGQEGVLLLDRERDGWRRTQLVARAEGGFEGGSEIRLGKLAGGKRCLATIEPFHGNQLAIYTPPAAGGKAWRRKLVDDNLAGGHAVAFGDLIGAGSDQLVAGWRDRNKDGKVGINIYVPADGEGKTWKRHAVDENDMACEDLKLGDLNGDGKPDIVAAGRRTKNLKVYWNTTGQ